MISNRFRRIFHFFLVMIVLGSHAALGAATLIDVEDGGKFEKQADGLWKETPPPQNICCIYGFKELSVTASDVFLYDPSRDFYLLLPIPDGYATWWVGSHGAERIWEFVFTPH